MAKYSHVYIYPGWKPRRSIILCSWGAEEYALIGSTEWVEVGKWKGYRTVLEQRSLNK